MMSPLQETVNRKARVKIEDIKEGHEYEGVIEGEPRTATVIEVGTKKILHRVNGSNRICATSHASFCEWAKRDVTKPKGENEN